MTDLTQSNTFPLPAGKFLNSFSYKYLNSLHENILNMILKIKEMRSLFQNFNSNGIGDAIEENIVEFSQHVMSKICAINKNNADSLSYVQNEILYFEQISEDISLFIEKLEMPATDEQTALQNDAKKEMIMKKSQTESKKEKTRITTIRMSLDGRKDNKLI
jgi:hypothetical protein